jgi:hypothetical protein
MPGSEDRPGPSCRKGTWRQAVCLNSTEEAGLSMKLRRVARVVAAFVVAILVGAGFLGWMTWPSQCRFKVIVVRQVCQVGRPT